MDEIIVLETVRHAVLLAVAIFATISTIRLMRTSRRPKTVGAAPKPNGFSTTGRIETAAPEVR